MSGVSPSLQGRGAGCSGSPAPLKSKARKLPPLSKSINFTVPGPLLGFRSSARRSFDERYRSWMRAVLWIAQAYGYPGRGKASREYPPVLHVSIRWVKEPKIDWSNVVKAIEDALWSDDRYVQPGNMEWVRNYGEEEARVGIEL